MSHWTQEAKIRAMATVQGSQLVEVIVDGGESAKSMNCPGMLQLLGLVNSGSVQAVVVAKLDRLTRSVKNLCRLLELFEKRKVALISVAESLDTGSAAGRLVITIMGAVSQWERGANTGRPSPDGRKLAAEVDGDIWVHDLHGRDEEPGYGRGRLRSNRRLVSVGRRDCLCLQPQRKLRHLYEGRERCGQRPNAGGHSAAGSRAGLVLRREIPDIRSCLTGNRG